FGSWALFENLFRLNQEIISPKAPSDPWPQRVKAMEMHAYIGTDRRFIRKVIIADCGRFVQPPPHPFPPPRGGRVKSLFLPLEGGRVKSLFLPLEGGEGQVFVPPPRGGEGQVFVPPPRGGEGQVFVPPPRGGRVGRG